MNNKSIEYYNINATDFYNNTVDADMNEAYNFFLQSLKSKAKILDAGCGSGRDSKYFMSKGYKVTAFDGSKEMVKLSSSLLNKQVLLMDFYNLKLEENFDGIWACASLLHVSKEDLPVIIKNLANNLNEGGIFYMSFKYGTQEYTKDSRYFNCYTEETFNTLITQIKSLKIQEMKLTVDVRKDRKNEKWLNILTKKI